MYESNIIINRDIKMTNYLAVDCDLMQIFIFTSDAAIYNNS